MSLNLEPLKWDWPPVTKGDTYPAANFTETEADSDLSRVRVEVKAAGSTTAALTLDSDATGVTINTATAGAWDFTVDAISAATTAGLTAGWYSYDLETTDAAGVVSTEFKGSWRILPEVTD